IALQLLILTALRPGELRQLRWSWIGGVDFETGETDNSAITLPPEIMKMRRPHVVPLSTQAVALIVELRSLTGGGEYLFPSSRDAKRAISDTAMNGALAALGYDSHTHVPHGGRSSFSTIANESGLF